MEFITKKKKNVLPKKHLIECFKNIRSGIYVNATNSNNTDQSFIVINDKRYQIRLNIKL